jgi:hypothetical protein
LPLYHKLAPELTQTWKRLVPKSSIGAMNEYARTLAKGDSLTAENYTMDHLDLSPRYRK